MPHDRVFQMASSNIRFGPGSTAEVGMDLRDMSAGRTMVLLDPNLRGLPVCDIVLDALKAERLDFFVFDEISIEPTDASFQQAAAAAVEGRAEAFLAVGGGSTIDTAKAANLYATWPADFLHYVNAPLGAGQAVPGPLKPLIAVPTTAGTGSETTGVAIFDLMARQAKTGIAHRYLKPILGVVDPENTRTLPPAVAAASGLDVLSHALESFTAIPFNQRPAPARPRDRPAYQGANPLSDVWALHALRQVAEFLPRAVEDPSDEEARGHMLLAAAMAGIGFGNAGVHLPHAMAYPVAGMVPSYRPEGYSTDHPLVPHGMSVILHTPAVARFTAAACPERHLQAAESLGADVRDVPLEQAGNLLATRIIEFMRRLGMPNGLQDIGFTDQDIPALVAGTLAQQRITRLSPRAADESDLSQMFRHSLTLW